MLLNRRLTRNTSKSKQNFRHIFQKNLSTRIRYDFGEKLNFETQIKTEVIGEAEWLNYLGDLLFQSNRYDDGGGTFKKISRTR